MYRPITFPLFVAAAASLPVLVDSAAKSCLVLTATAGVVLALRGPSASHRHLLWILAMFGLLLLPAVSLVLPEWRVLPSWLDVSELARSGESVENATVQTGVASGLGPLAEDLWLDVPVPPPGGELDGTVASPNLSGHVAEVMPADRSAIRFQLLAVLLTVLVWVAGVVTLCFRLLLSRLVLRRLVKASKLATQGAAGETLAMLCRRCDIRRRVRLLVSDRCDMPMTWGIHAGHILLPRESEGWDESRLRAVLLHELAHVKRRDALWQLLVQLVCALYWFNPLVWLAGWRVRVERERACDDFVLNRGVKASDYAGHLIAISTGYEGRSLAAVCALAMAKKLKLEGRLMRVLNAKANRRGATRRTCAMCCLGVIAYILPVAMMRAGNPSPSGRQAPETPVRENRTSDESPASAEAAEPDVEVDAVAALKDLGADVELDDARRVVSLTINDPQLSDADIDHVRKLTHLRELRLNSPNVTDRGVEQLKGLQNLQSLDLRGCSITGRGLESIRELRRLKSLIIARTKITDAGLEHVGGLAELEGLSLANTQITDDGLPHLEGLTNLRTLSLALTEVTDKGLENLKAHPELRMLSLLAASSVTDSGLAHVGKLTKLEQLILGYTGITEAGLKNLEGLNALKFLDLAGVDLSREGLIQLQSLSSLGGLNLSQTSITDDDLEPLTGLETLTMLMLGHNEIGISDAGLEHLKRLTNLEHLSLQGTKVTEAGIHELKEALPDCDIQSGEIIAVSFDRLDRNRDGKLTTEEIPVRMRARGLRADTNGDGVISKEEFEAHSD